MNRSDKPAEDESNRLNTYIPPYEVEKENYAVKHTFFTGWYIRTMIMMIIMTLKTVKDIGCVPLR